ncbi:hypothetical protein CM49_02057 [Paenibacillus sp. P1XP2]|nr:hypothetical protein CM49_02057 [Paenibacillus sp. P1XP2]
MTALSPMKIIPLLLPAALLIILVVMWLPEYQGLLNNEYVHTFKTGFIGILLEALPFILAGALLSPCFRYLFPMRSFPAGFQKGRFPASCSRACSGSCSRFANAA